MIAPEYESTNSLIKGKDDTWNDLLDSFNPKKGIHNNF